MRFTFDKEADAMAIELVQDGRSVSTKRIGGDARADFDKAGHLIGIEILNASTHYPLVVLERLESPVIWLSLVAAEKESGLAVSTLRKQINKGRIKATKRGRDWEIALHDLMNYLETRDPRGKPPRRRRARRKMATEE